MSIINEKKFLSTMYCVKAGNINYFLWKYDSKVVKCESKFDDEIQTTVYTFHSNSRYWLKLKFVNGVTSIQGRGWNAYEECLTLETLTRLLNVDWFVNLNIDQKKYLTPENQILNKFGNFYGNVKYSLVHYQ